MLMLYLSVIEDPTDQIEFERIYIQYRKQMYYLAKSIINDSCCAEDIVHDVFTVLAAKHMATLRKIKNEDDLRNYLLKATKNTCLNHLRSQTYERTVLEETQRIVTMQLEDESFLDKFCAKMDANMVVDAIKALPQAYRQVLYYRYVAEMSPPEIAKSLNRKLSTVKKQLQRGKNMLLETLNHIGGEEYDYKV